MSDFIGFALIGAIAYLAGSVGSMAASSGAALASSRGRSKIAKAEDDYRRIMAARAALSNERKPE